MSLSYEHLLTASHILRIKSRLLTRLCLSWPLPTSLTLSPTNLFLVHIDLAILGFVPPWAHVKLVATLGPLQLALAFAWNPLPRPPRGCPFLLTQVFPKCGPTKRPSWSQDLRSCHHLSTTASCFVWAIVYATVTKAQVPIFLSLSEIILLTCFLAYCPTFSPLENILLKDRTCSSQQCLELWVSGL